MYNFGYDRKSKERKEQIEVLKKKQTDMEREIQSLKFAQRTYYQSVSRIQWDDA